MTLWISEKVPLLLLPQRMFTGVDSFTLLAIPLFMIAGRLMERGGISKRLIDLAMNIVGSTYGGLAHVAILSCMFFSAISGSAPATVVAIGTIMVPAMVKEGYDKTFAVALMAAAGIVGVIIPPSIPFVSYGVSMGVSIGELFAAGTIPGFIMGMSLMCVCYIYCRKRNLRGAFKVSWIGFFKALKESIWGLMMPIIILGGIYGGVFTPTESAAVACVYGLLVGIFVYKELTISETITSFWEAGITSSMVLLIISCATAMGWILTAERIPVLIAESISSFATSHFSLLLLLNCILLFTGCFMEPNAAIIILGPIFLPLLMKFDINLIHFGVVMVVNMAIGMMTPPLGVNLFVAGSLQGEVAFKDIVIKTLPFLGVLLFDLMLFSYLPELSLLVLRFL